MIKVLLIAPYLQCKELADKVFAGFEDRSISLQAVYAVGVKFINSLQVDCDAIIARGATASALRLRFPHIPVIDLPVTGYDVIHAVHECGQRFRARKIAVMGSDSMIYDVQRVSTVLDVQIECFRVMQEEEAEQGIEIALQRGFDAVISGGMVVGIARRRGMNAILIESGQEAIVSAVREAVRTAQVAKQNQAVTGRIKAIMDYAYEGVVAVDENGNITVFNKTAAEITGISAESALNRHIRSVLPETGLLRVLETGEAELGELQKLNGIMVAKNRIPVKIKDKVVGAVATFQKVSELQQLESQIRKKIHHKGLNAKYFFGDIIGHSAAIQETVERTRKYSKVDSNVLLIGETGTGKEILAQSCHNSSNRRSGPFVAVNCAALPENLLESELFGYVEGAFTGAARGGKPGLFELAHQGTIFLDEVSEIPLKLQGRLLRVLQEREIMRLGDDRIIPVDVRVISATNRDLKNLAAENGFRRDLLYRIDVLHIQVPPLRERRDDIPLLLEYFFALYNRKFGKNIRRVAPEARELLTKYEWPGNVRELRNVCEQLAVLAEGNEIEPEEVVRVIGRPLLDLEFGSDIRAAKPAIATIDIAKIRQVLAAAEGNKTKAAELLGISRTTLWRKLMED
ncbi:MAG: sigma-54 dependent transcriptional regulator [Firmicutes bacterium]|nr:sigma-54 dependent transcriptional regulator [Bacillota bacterium]